MSVGKVPAVAKKKRGGRGPGRKNKPQREYCKGRWTCQEKLLFLVGLRKYGKGKWKEIAKILTTRSPVQIKSHGQKLYSKLKPGDDVFHDLKEYERSTGTHLVPGDTNDTPPYVSVHHITLAQQQQKRGEPLFQSPATMDYDSHDEDDYPSMLEDEESDEENLPPAVAALKSDPLSISKPRAKPNPSFLTQSDGAYSHGLYQPLLQSHFGSPTGISFLNDSPPLGSTTSRSSSTLASSLGTGKRPAQNQQDVHAAMVLCQMDSISKSLPPAPLAPTATRLAPLFGSNTAASTSQQSFSSLAASSAFEPISLKSMGKEPFDDTLLAACFSEILENAEPQKDHDDDDDDGSNVVTPTAFADEPTAFAEV